MKYEMSVIKGIAPGAIIARELRDKHISNKDFAAAIGEYPSRISEIINVRRRIPLPMSLKFDSFFGFEKGFFATIQLYYEVRRFEESQQHKTPDLKKLSHSLFWDTDVKKINWIRQKNSVLERVEKYGTASDIKIISDFYDSLS